MSPSAIRYALVSASIAAVAAAIVGALVMLGPPAEERSRRLDTRRVEDLRGIAAAVDVYRSRHTRLPASLKELSQDSGIRVGSRDPVIAEPYSYRVLDEKTYELCAVFERDSGERSPGTTGDFWSHGTGRRCFRLETKEIRG